MLKSILAFALTRRPIVLMALLVFVVVGAVAYFKLNIEAYRTPLR
jgi:cobalt-zinc-cadmium resistance protein CzcA